MSDAAARRHWDAVIVGTGIGGATLGYALAKAGRSVLFVEKGRSRARGNALVGDYAETFADAGAGPSAETYANAGRATERIEDLSGGRAKHYLPFTGCGTGGSSALYGMALERFFPVDFGAEAASSGGDSAAAPRRWPIDYDALRPFYAAAEALYRVRTSADPLRAEASPPSSRLPALSAASRELHDFFVARGLHPYRLPLACELAPGCRVCQGYLCAKECKNDSARTCLEPALSHYGAQLLDRCEVVRLETAGRRVTGVVCARDRALLTLRADRVFLAAGALETPRILLQSGDGALANASGLVGRNLMRHYIDLYAIFPHAAIPREGNVKEIAFNDFYSIDGGKFGSVQAFGRMPPGATLAAGLEQDIYNGGAAWAAPAFRGIKPALAALLDRVFSRALVLATLVEDLPYPENRVRLSGPPDAFGRRRLAIEYRIGDRDRARIAAHRARMQALLKPYRYLRLKQAESNQHLAHACGTCRFGADAAKSVLDTDNRAHELENLYGVDSSFFPSSAGTNPALTIAANALRVADRLLGKARVDAQAATTRSVPA